MAEITLNPPLLAARYTTLITEATNRGRGRRPVLDGHFHGTSNSIAYRRLRFCAVALMNSLLRRIELTSATADLATSVE